MPRVKNKEPEKLRPYLFHGLPLVYDKDDKEAICQCPFCDREEKFSVDIGTGQYRCFVCGVSGNTYTFIRAIWDLGWEASTYDQYNEFAIHRKLIDFETPMLWSVVRSVLVDNWLIPGYAVDGKLNQLYKYVETRDGWKLYPTPTLGHQLHGRNLYDKKKPIVYVCEGPWDGMALWEMLRRVEVNELDQYQLTFNQKTSLGEVASVLAIPGANTFFKEWIPLFADKDVCFVYDNDHPRVHPKTGARIEPAALEGMKRASKILSSSKTPPKSIQYLKWDEAGYDLNLPNGFDIRDIFTDA
jgi:hypothetical protein